MTFEPNEAPAKLRKGERTREKIMAATIQVLGRVGYPAASVMEITRAAKVSNGTFYLYFENKEDVIETTIFRRATAIMQRVHEQERDIADVVDRCIFGLRMFLSIVLEDFAWARAMLAAYAVLPELRVAMNKYGLANLEAGVAESTFSVTLSAYQIEAINAVVMMAVRMQIDGTAGPDVVDQCIEIALRMLGVPPERIHAGIQKRTETKVSQR